MNRRIQKAYSIKRQDWPRQHHYIHQHYERWKRRVMERTHKLICQDCGGAGGYIELVSWELGGPWYDCGWCEGTGYVDNWRRAAWLGSRAGWDKLTREVA